MRQVSCESTMIPWTSVLTWELLGSTPPLPLRTESLKFHKNDYAEDRQFEQLWYHVLI